MGLEGGTDAFGRALEFDRPRDDATQVAQPAKAQTQGLVPPARGQAREEPQMDAILFAAGPRPPRLLGGEATDRRQPGGETGEQMVEHRAAGAPAHGIRTVAIERILTRIEVKGGEVDGAEIMQRR